MEKVRILYTQATIGSGGVERRRLSLIRSLNKNSYEIKVVCTTSFGPLADEMRSEGAEVITIGELSKAWNLCKYKAVVKIIKEFKPHIIHGAVFEGVLLSTIGGTIGRVPIIIAEETSDPTGRSRRATLLIKLLSCLTDKFIGVSSATYNYLLTQAKVEPAKLKLIFNGVSPPPEVDLKVVEDLKIKLNIKQGDFVVGSVGRLYNNVKLFTDIIDSIYLLKETHPHLKLIIVGDGPDREYIESHIICKGVSDHVILVGYQSNPHPFFKLMHLFALVSSTESFGLAAVEAMFHKLPVIATKVGGLKEVVLHEETGLLVDVKNPEQIATAIQFLCSNPSLMFNMGQKGCARALKEFSAVRYVQDVEKLYINLLSEKKIYNNQSAYKR